MIALIHNGSTERLSAIRPPLRRMAHELGADLREFHWQPSLDSSRVRPLRRFVSNRSSERAHRRHLRFRGSGRPSATLLPAVRELVRATVWGASGTPPFCSALIEQVLTDKHARAWSTFLDSEAEALVVLEDDAVVPEDAAARLAAILADDRIDSRGLLYLDLAGGFPLRKLCGASVLEHLDGGLIRLRAPFGNTTCAYAVSRPLAAAMFTELTWDPVLRRIGPDWLVNELMMRIHVRTPIDCIHTEPTVLGHGSFLGAHESHIQTRPPQKG